MAELSLPLTSEERDLLLNMLHTALGETRVELHHTHFSPEFRDQVKHERDLLSGLLEKLRQVGT